MSREYSPELRARALNLLESEEASLASVSKSLGVSVSTLRRWRSEAADDRSADDGPTDDRPTDDPSPDPDPAAQAPSPVARQRSVAPESALLDLMPELTTEDLELILDRAEIRKYREGKRLCTQGALEETFYVLLSGQVDVIRTADGEPVLLNFLTAGDGFGELSLLLEQPRYADIVSTEDIEVLEFHRNEFDRLALEYPTILRAIAQRSLRQLLRDQDRRVTEAARIQKKRRESLPEIFVSYSRQDSKFTETLAARLRHNGIKVWLDVHEIQPGMSWPRQIGDALDRSKLMLLVLSPESMGSENSGDEWNYFLDKGKPVIPVLYRACDRPYRINKLQYIDFENQSYDTALSQLISAILSRAEDEPAD